MQLADDTVPSHPSRRRNRSASPGRRVLAGGRFVKFFCATAFACACVWLLADRSAASGQETLSALRLLPDSAAGVVRVPDVPTLCDAWESTTIGKLTDDEALQPLLEANFGEAGTVWQHMGDRVGLRPKDLYQIGTGEAVAAWLTSTEARRPSSALCVVAEVEGDQQETREVLDRIDAELKQQEATRTDRTYQGETVRVYRPKVKPGQLLIEQIVICLTDDRIIAADRDSIVNGVLDAIAAGGRADSLADAELRNRVLEDSYSRSKLADAESADTDGIRWHGDVVEWFAKPLEVGRIIRDLAKIDRGNKVKIIDLLEQQGFDAIQAAGGIVLVGGEKFDLLHRGFVLAPPIPGEPQRYRLAARMLQFPNASHDSLPAWVPADVASFARINWKLEDAFWAAETLVDQALDSRIFRPSIEGIRDDEEGPQIDLEKNVLPNLDDQVVVLTDNTLPVGQNSDRLLLAIRVKDAAAIQNAVRKAMEVEPDVFQIDTVPGVEIWKVQRGEEDEIEAEFFDDLGFDDAVEDQEQPLLNTWAIAVVPAAKQSEAAHLVFASHVELLEEVARRMMGTDQTPGLREQPEIVQQQQALVDELGAEEVAIERLVRLRLSLRTKYELLRQGELKESDSILATIIRRLVEGDDDGLPDEIERPNQAKWPPFSELEEYFRNAVSFVETTDSGWTLNAVLLK